MAYTSLALGAHTDNTYFNEPAGLQMFHLLSHTEGEGGESLLVDGYRAHYELSAQSENLVFLEEQPARKADIDALSCFMTGHATGNDGAVFRSDYRTFQGVFPADRAPIVPWRAWGSVRWNNEDRAAALGRSQARIREWYAAARKFSRILKEDTSEYWFRLEPGRPLSRSKSPV
jgi:trimethyllysine dioxygenase